MLACIQRPQQPFTAVLLHSKPLLPLSSRFIRVGGYRLLNSWLTYSKTTNNTPLLQLILLTLQKLPLKVDHLKQVLLNCLTRFQVSTTLYGQLSTKPALIFSQNNTAKLVKQLSKSAETEGQFVCTWKTCDCDVHSSVYATNMLLPCRAKEAGIRARRRLDGYDPLPECLKQQ